MIADANRGDRTSMPEPLSVIWSNFKPPSFTETSTVVDPASTEFSINSFKAFTGATMISPAAILLMTSSSRGYEHDVSAARLKKRWCRELYLDSTLGGVVVKSISLPLGTARAIHLGIHLHCITHSGAVECSTRKKSVMRRKSRRILSRSYPGIQISPLP